MTGIDPHGFFPVLTTPALRECRDFYTRHFGFRVAFEAPWYVHLVSARGIQLGFLQPGHPSQPACLQAAYPGEGTIWSFEVEDADAAHARLAGAGVEVLLAPRTEDWGQRHFLVRAPGGMIVDVVEATAPATDYEGSYAP